jgi:hypothetical protein
MPADADITKPERAKPKILLWECGQCGAVELGVHPPVACPTCAYPPSVYKPVSSRGVEVNRMNIDELEALSLLGLGSLEAE